VLRVAFLLVGLLLAYQLVVTLLQSAWIDPATDGLLDLVALTGLLGVVLLSLWLKQPGQPGALSWWLVSGGLLARTLARTLWLLEDLVLFPRQVPMFSPGAAPVAAGSSRNSAGAWRVWRWMPASCWGPHWPSPGASFWPPFT
jgi:hypothetical protein